MLWSIVRFTYQRSTRGSIARATQSSPTRNRNATPTARQRERRLRRGLGAPFDASSGLASRSAPASAPASASPLVSGLGSTSFAISARANLESALVSRVFDLRDRH